MQDQTEENETLFETDETKPIITIPIDNNQPHTPPIKFPKDICYEIMQFLDHQTILKNCSTISKNFNKISNKLFKFKLEFKNSTSRNDFLTVLKDENRYSKYVSNICSLTLPRDCLSVEGMNKIVEIISPQLIELNIPENHTLAHEDGFSLIGSLTKLQKLNISKIFYMFPFIPKSLDVDTVINLKSISKLENLTSLETTQNRLRDEDLEIISQMSQLTKLNISDNDFGVNGIKFLTRLTKLTDLDIYYNNISVEGVEFISGMSQLTRLNISQNAFGSEGVNHLTKLSLLKELNIDYTNFGNRGIEIICKSMPQLTHLSIFSRYDSLIDNVAEGLISLQSLKYLKINAISEKSLNTLRNSLPNTEIDGQTELCDIFDF